MKIGKEKYLLSFFISSIDMSDKSALCSLIKVSLGEVGLNEVILPVPDESPPEVPRILMNHKAEKDFQIEVYPNRFNIRFNRKYIALNELLVKLVTLFNELEFKITRLGLVHSFTYADLEKPAPQIIEENYLKEDIQDGYQDVATSYLKKLEIGDFQANFWTRHTIDSSDPKRPTYFLEFDANTDTDIKRVAREKIRGFCLDADSLILGKKEAYEQRINP